MSPLRWLAVACLGGLACSPGLAFGQETLAEAAVERRALDHAARLEEAGRREEAMRALENLLDEHPGSVSALVLLGRITVRAGEPARSLARAEAAAARSDLPALRQVWIRALQAAGMRDSAFSVARRWLENEPREASAYLELSGLWAREGNVEEAVRVLKEGRKAVGSDRLFVQEVASLQAEAGFFDGAAAEWRAMLAWGEAGVEAVERGITGTASRRSSALAALRAELAEAGPTLLERKGGLHLALRLREFEWAKEVAAGLAEDLPGPSAQEVLRDFVGRARQAGDLAGAAWGAEELVSRARSRDDRLYWMTVAAELSHEAGDTRAARAAFDRLISETEPGSDPYEIALRRLQDLTVRGDPERADELLTEYMELYPDSHGPAVRMSLRLAREWTRMGRMERARDAISRVPAGDMHEAAAQAGVLGRLEILGGRPTAARGHLELAAGVPAGQPDVRIEALELLALLDNADSSSVAALGKGVIAAMTSRDPRPLEASAQRWSRENTPGGPGLALFAASELQDAGQEREARSIRILVTESWPESPEAPRALLDLARADRTEDPGQAVEWLERLIVEHPESAMAPLARRLLEEMQSDGMGE